MGRVTQEQLDQLQPYIVGRPDGRGEVAMYCTQHADNRPSASINLTNGAFFCHAGCGGGSVEHLLLSAEDWVPPPGRNGNGHASIDVATWADSVQRSSVLLERCARRWHAGLMESQRALGELRERRGITQRTARAARLGWNGVHFKIPIFRPDRKLWNIKTWDPLAADWGSRKYWNARGLGSLRLYPIGVLARLRPGDSIVFTEGEWDALLALQIGIPAITHTGGASRNKWRKAWNQEFEGLNVHLMFDRDRAGDEAAATIGAALAGEAEVESVIRCELPFAWQEKNGRDLSDLIRESPQGTAARQVMDVMRSGMAL